MSHFFAEKSFTIKRQTYVGSKSSYATVAAGFGHFRALSEEQASVNGLQYGKAHSLETELGVDIREADKVVIDSVEYTVRGVATHNHGSTLDYKRALLTLPETS